MKPSTLYRLGALVLLFHATGHTFGGVVFYHAHTPAEASVIQAMQASRVDIMGVTRSLWDFYYGWGLAVGALSYVLAGMVWMLGRPAARPAEDLGGLTALAIAGCLSQTLLCVRYFFLLPALLTLSAAILCGVAWLRQRSDALPKPKIA
jgi:hypothetical protein